ncbi:MAG: response regulator [bacterium]
MNILLMDDDCIMLSMLKGAFERWGFKVDAYSNPTHCSAYCSAACPCALFKNGCPDVILTDVNMPKVSGVSFIKELMRKNCKCSKIGMMSGNWSDPDLLSVTHFGVTVFAKPFDLSRMHAWLLEDRILHVA